MKEDKLKKIIDDVYKEVFEKKEMFYHLSKEVEEELNKSIMERIKIYDR